MHEDDAGSRRLTWATSASSAAGSNPSPWRTRSLCRIRLHHLRPGLLRASGSRPSGVGSVTDRGEERLLLPGELRGYRQSHLVRGALLHPLVQSATGLWKGRRPSTRLAPPARTTPRQQRIAGAACMPGTCPGHARHLTLPRLSVACPCTARELLRSLRHSSILMHTQGGGATSPLPAHRAASSSSTCPIQFINKDLVQMPAVACARPPSPMPRSLSGSWVPGRSV